MHFWNKRVKPEGETNILRCHHQFGKQVGNHLLCHAKSHFQIPQADTTSNKMISYLQVSYVSQLCQIRCDMQTRFGIGVEPIGPRIATAEKSDHILGMQ